MQSQALLFYLMLIGVSGEPDPNVRVNINVNANGEPEKAVEPVPTCSLEWNYEEERPLIMIRESKTIVPPVTYKDISDNPNRIPVGRKLIFACPGDNNQFNHVEGIHTKLHGECVSHDTFKVCVNNNPVFLDLSELSCSSRMYPSFIKDNDTSEKSCDVIGGELYKTGYTYGDYHEFKDLDLEVCFKEKNQTTLCTSPNLNGNKTDYMTAKHSGVDPRGIPKKCNECDRQKICKDLGASPVAQCMWKPERGSSDCPNYVENTKKKKYCKSNIEGEADSNCVCCFQNAINSIVCDTTPREACKILGHQIGLESHCMATKEECLSKYLGGEFKEQKTNEYCFKKCGCCIPKNPCGKPQPNFKRKHVCNGCMDNAGALKFISGMQNTGRSPNDKGRDGEPIKGSTVFSNTGMTYKKALWGTVEVCEIVNPVSTWYCTVGIRGTNDERFWESCTPKSGKKCTAKYDKSDGHLYIATLNPSDCDMQNI